MKGWPSNVLVVRAFGRCVAAACVTALLVLAGGRPASAAIDAPTDSDTVAPAESAPVASAGELDGRRTMGRLPANLGHGFIGVFHRDNLVPVVIGGVVTGGASFFDDDLRDAVSNPDSGFGKALETAGGWPAAVVVAGLFTGGRFAHGTRFRAMTYDLGDAMIVNFAYTSILKVAVRRERPDGSNNQSFPSGHASDAFTLATVVERHCGWKWGVPAYALAATIGFSRIVRDKHYLSDVLAGATLGYVVGRTVVRVNDKPLAAGAKKLGVSPIVSRHARGLQLSVEF
jgi:membrane-associated phospholipid phosphatase